MYMNNVINEDFDFVLLNRKSDRTNRPFLGPDLRLVSAKTSPKTSPEAKNDKIPILARWKCYKHVPNQI